jgi:hypothetical protein
MRDILVRIRIRGSVPLTHGIRIPAPDPAIFVLDLQDANKKLYLLFTFEGIFTAFF